MKYLIAVFFLFTSHQSFSQTLNTKNFTTSLDGFISSDSSNIIRLTKEQLMNIISKQLHTNFVWAHIKSLTFYFSGSNGSDVVTSSCKGDIICPELKTYFEHTQSGTIISIEPNVFNNQGKQIDWNGIIILIK